MRGSPGAIGKGMAGCARLVAALRDEPMTTLALEASYGLSPGTARRMTRRLFDAGILCVVDWREPTGATGHGPAARVFGFGKAPRGVPQMPLRADGTCSRHVGAIAKVKTAEQTDRFVRIWQLLAGEPISVSGLIVATGIHDHTLQAILRVLREVNLARIAAWDCDSGRTPLWRLGRGLNARRPPCQTPTETSRRYRAKRDLRRHGVNVTHAMAANASIFRLAQGAA